ncbi:protein VACUOLELESS GAMETOPHYTES-like [Typha latifolia]|uniref:protein VACUOLELESS GAMETOPHYTES-like n=1 Tax=Typha latifolia TaxID=4733 RepID=UPI003C301D6D
MERVNKEEETVIHISHLHPLHLTDLDDGENKETCHGCHLPCTGSTYRCAPCHYFLHSSCALFPRTINHHSHPSHLLTLLLTPAYRGATFSCNACKQDGAAFSFHCSGCLFDLHLPCAALPKTLNHPSHPHPMILVCGYPQDGCTCDLCEAEVDVSRWLYLCEGCDYGGHVGCFASETRAKEEYEFHEQADQNLKQPANPMVALLAKQQELRTSMIMADSLTRFFRETRM